MLTPEIIEARRKLVAKNERELSKQPPRPLQPGDKVSLVGTCVINELSEAEAVVKFDSLPFEYCLPLSAIRPFPQEEV